VWHVPISGGTPTRIVDDSIGVFGFSDVSPDGRSIVLALGGKWTVCDFPACTVRKPIVNTSGSRPRWTADGRGIAYIDGLTGTNLWVQLLDGSGPRALTHFTDGRTIGHYAWSQDGQRLAISRATFSSDIVLFRGLKARGGSNQ
jgi:Tol biopolymer transport system component